MSEPWMRLEMSPAEEDGGYDALQEAFYSAFTRAGAPPDAVLYVGDGAFYFTPAAARLFALVLQARAAQPCPPPSLDSLAVLVSNTGAPL